MVFDFRLSRGRDGPKRFLGQFEGILQTDGYAAYDPDRWDEILWGHQRIVCLSAGRVSGIAPLEDEPVLHLIQPEQDATLALDVVREDAVFMAREALQHLDREVGGDLFGPALSPGAAPPKNVRKKSENGSSLPKSSCISSSVIVR